MTMCHLNCFKNGGRGVDKIGGLAPTRAVSEFHQRAWDLPKLLAPASPPHPVPCSLCTPPSPAPGRPVVGSTGIPGVGHRASSITSVTKGATMNRFGWATRCAAAPSGLSMCVWGGGWGAN